MNIPVQSSSVQGSRMVQSNPDATALQPETIAPTPPTDIPLCLLQIGDTIEIKHYYHPDLNETVTVRADGKISLPLLDEIHVSGLTPSQLDNLLTEQYSRSLKQPELTVILRQSSTQRIFVGGEVIRPGVINMNGPVSCLQAVMQAGGYRTTAEPANVVIMRNQGTEKPIFLVANLKYDAKKNILPENIALQPQDVVFVPRSKIAEINLWVEQYIDKVLPFSRSVGAYYSFDEGVTN
ncbi:MAG: polysaccharide export protein [Sedimentisphaerales bacterium]|nr:polysaccharide export protein [Sedimentisphaerales bacterium]